MEENNNKNKKKLLLVIAVSAVLMVLSIGGAYAFFSGSANNSGSQITGRTLDINGATLTITAQRVTMNPTTTPVSDNLVPAKFGATPTNITTTEVNRALTKNCSLNGYTGCHVWKITASSTQTVASANIRLNLNVTNVTDKQEWSYVVYTGTDSSSSNILYKGLINTDFGNAVNTIDIHNGAGLTANTSVIYYVMVYLNNTNSVQNDGVTVNTTNETGAYNGSVVLEAMDGKVKVNFLDIAADYITNLYTNAQKSTATVNNITYNLAPSVGLMNDRHASMSTDINGGDIRYYGANPNNYVWLGDSYTSDYTFASNRSRVTRTAGTKKLWRIVGVFDGKIKVISNDRISGSTDLSWDTSDDYTTGTNGGYGINQWGESTYSDTGNVYEGADLMKLLNPGFENNQDLNTFGNTITVNNSLYWNKGTGKVLSSSKNGSTDIDFLANTGLSSSEKSMIDTATWYLGAYSGNVSYVDAHYIAERQSSILGKTCSSGAYCNDNVVRTPTWNGKVGLIYPSDYGYATDLSQCDKQLSSYSDSANSYACRSNNWLFDSSYSQWTISPYAYNTSNRAFFADSDGSLVGDGAYKPCAVRPAVYLKSGVVITGGNGTESNPYVLSY